MKMSFITIIVLFFVIIASNILCAQNNSPDLVIDISGSMAPYGTSIVKISQDILRKYKESKVFLFNDEVEVITSAKKLENLSIGGGTNLTSALQRVDEESTSRAIILITDGKPNNEKSAKRTALDLRAKGVSICSAYTGRHDLAPQFLKDISNVIILNHSIESSLENCLDEFRNIGLVIDPKRNVDIERLLKELKY